MILKRILTKTGVLLFILVLMTISVIYMNFTGVEPNDAFMMLYGALIAMFVSEKDDNKPNDIG